MSSESHNYRPRSPDLSAYSPPPPQLSNAQQFAYAPQHRGSYDASPYFSPQTTTPSQSYFGTQPQAPFQTFDPTGQPFVTPQAFNPHIISPHQYHYPSQQESTMPRRQKGEELDEYIPDDDQMRAGGRAARQNLKSESGRPTHAGDGPSQGIDVKTKFPVARIKRLMQSDEDIGKVAQATPTAVSKALELFMISLVTKAATEARDKSSKRVTAAHLRSVLANDKVYDFLDDTVANIPDTAENKGKTRARSDSLDPMDEGKKKRTSRNKTKGAAQD